ncbi:hypothetical protein [Geoalkalibacter halelectricus]|uniref:hypothetical protein n=1 Tax=Geoalkalibacter halelectricus TaxID=2847045 RepID=UPI003D237C57
MCDENGARKKAEKKAPNSISWVGTLVMVLVVGALISAAAIKIYHDQFATKITAVDMRSMVEDLRAKTLRGEITQEQMFERFDALEEIISSQPPGTVVLLKEVILNHGNEIKP